MMPGDLRPLLGRRQNTIRISSVARFDTWTLPTKRSDFGILTRLYVCHQRSSSFYLVLITALLVFALMLASWLLRPPFPFPVVQVESLPEGGGRNNHLILVAGHSVYMSHNFTDPGQNSNWYLLDYQKVPGQAESFIEHIRIGVQEAANDANSVLVFSGGYTREDAGAISEGGSYWHVADSLNWFGHTSVKSRAMLEDRARDSMENLLFSICRFRQFTSAYPQNITIISYDFKEERFLRQHALALRIPDTMITFIGTPALDRAGAEKGETQTLQEFTKDPYACHGPLQDKRAGRDPFHNGIPDANTCPALQPFLTGKCNANFYTGPVPWRQRQSVRDKTLIS